MLEHLILTKDYQLCGVFMKPLIGEDVVVVHSVVEYFYCICMGEKEK